MIGAMRLWCASVLVCLAVGCGASQPGTGTGEPTTAKEKQHRDAEAKGEVDPPSSKWGGWRYTGSRDNCFFVVGRRCFKTVAEACSTTKCKTSCAVTGGGPATVACKK